MRIPRISGWLLTVALAAPVVAAPQDTAPAEIERREDDPTPPELAFHDALGLQARADGEQIHFSVEMKRPVADGMFTCVYVDLDCDNNSKTGIDGAEIQVRSSIGARFRPNTYRSASGRSANDIRRTTWSSATRVDRPGGGFDSLWEHKTDALDPPKLSDRKIEFTIPVRVIRTRGGRYGSIVGLRVYVETTCSEQPLMVRTTCGDDGLPIVLDGKAAEWSTARLARDVTGELHPVARFLDLESLRVEHDADKVYACVQFAEGGFADGEPNTDVVRKDRLVFFVQPLFPRYQSPVQVELKWGEAQQSGTIGREDLAWSAVVQGNTVEFAIERRSGQTQFRVFAWSDLLRTDLLTTDGFVPINWSGAKQP